MNNNVNLILCSVLFASIGGAAGYFLGQESTNNPQIIDHVSGPGSLDESDSSQGVLDKENKLLRAQLKEALGEALAPSTETEPKDANKQMTPREIMIALSRATNDPNPISRSQVFADLLANLSEDNLDGVLEVYNDLPVGFENMHEYRLLMYAWGKFDAPAAIEYVNGRATGMGSRFAATGALEGWASQDPQAAVRWVQLQEDQRTAQIYNMGIVRGWASNDVAGAAEYVTTLEDSWGKSRMVGMLTSQYLKEGFTSARQWAETLEDDGLKASAFRNLSRQQGREEPAEVAAWLKDHAGKEYSEGSFEELGENWGRRDPAAAIEYFETLPEGEGRRQGLLEVVEEWSRKDTEAVGNWLNERSQSETPLPELDEAIGEYAREASRENAAEAMQWATAIQDDELKEKTITRVGQNWMRQDEEAVKAWLPTSNLTEEVQKAIVTPPEEGRRWGGGPPRGPR